MAKYLLPTGGKEEFFYEELPKQYMIPEFHSWLESKLTRFTNLSQEQLKELVVVINSTAFVAFSKFLGDKDVTQNQKQ